MTRLQQFLMTVAMVGLWLPSVGTGAISHGVTAMNHDEGHEAIHRAAPNQEQLKTNHSLKHCQNNCQSDRCMHTTTFSPTVPPIFDLAVYTSILIVHKNTLGFSPGYPISLYRPPA